VVTKTYTLQETHASLTNRHPRCCHTFRRAWRSDTLLSLSVSLTLSLSSRARRGVSTSHDKLCTPCTGRLVSRASAGDAAHAPPGSEPWAKYTTTLHAQYHSTRAHTRAHTHTRRDSNLDVTEERGVRLLRARLARQMGNSTAPAPHRAPPSPRGFLAPLNLPSDSEHAPCGRVQCPLCPSERRLAPQVPCHAMVVCPGDGGRGRARGGSSSRRRRRRGEARRGEVKAVVLLLL